MSSSFPHPTDYEVGDLVILLHSVDWMGYHAPAGSIAIVLKVYDKTNIKLRNIYDCRIKMTSGAELDCSFGEIYHLKSEPSHE